MCVLRCVSLILNSIPKKRGKNDDQKETINLLCRIFDRNDTPTVEQRIIQAIPIYAFNRIVNEIIQHSLCCVLLLHGHPEREKDHLNSMHATRTDTKKESKNRRNATAQYRRIWFTMHCALASRAQPLDICTVHSVVASLRHCGNSMRLELGEAYAPAN